MLRDYYDTKFADDARISTIFCYILMDDFKEAQNYFDEEIANFSMEEKGNEARSMLKKYKDGIGLDGLYRLYK